MKNKKIALKGAVLITCTGEPAIENSLLLIDGNKIEYAGEYREEIDLKGYQVVDVKGKTIMPGMVEAHIHFCGTLEAEPAIWMAEDNNLEAIIATAQVKTVLEHGFTSARDISRFSQHLKKAIEDGIIQGPRIFATGRGICRTGGHGDCPAFPRELVEARHPWAKVADTPDGMRVATRELLGQNVDGIKIWTSGGGIHAADIEMDTHMTFEEIKAVVEEASYLGKPVISHCEGLQSARFSIDAGCYSIEHGEEMDDYCIEKMEKQRTFFVPTLTVLVNWTKKFEIPYRPEHDNFPGETTGEKEINRLFANFKKCKDAGIRTAVGADCFADKFTPYGTDSLNEVYCFVEAGCSEMDALMSATKYGAELLRFDQIVGTLEKGKLADLIVLSKNPLDNIKNLSKANMELIMKDGDVIVSGLPTIHLS